MDIRSVSGSSANRLTASPLPEAAGAGEPAVPDASSPVPAESKATGAGGYISPFLRYDQGARVAVLLFRDIDTGETQDQIPSRRVVEEYRRTASRLSQSADENGAGGGPTASTSRAGTGDAAANRGISFASFGTSGSAVASPANSGSGMAPGGSGSGSASGPTVSSGAALPLAGGGGGAASPGGLVSVTV